ncbi:MAG: endo-1,4-beta-xylanase [Lachnospiraceae bacterium]|nr:endo-1,4-beta-xylanase [Lachnospiraceae bacterium]
MRIDKSTLWERYKPYFRIGAAVDEDKMERYYDLLQHFNSITPENQLKPVIVHPNKDEYRFEKCDRLVDYAKENGKVVRGHTLVWHNQTPQWMFARGEDTVKNLQEHIQTIMDQYKDTIHDWDVVNEIFSDEEDELLRKTEWLKYVGEKYVDLALNWAHEANPRAELFINDYNIEIGKKADKAIDYIVSLKKRGIPITGFGLQSHYRIYYPTIDIIRGFFSRISKLNIKIRITELDVSMFSYEDHSHMAGPSLKLLDLQKKYYESLFTVYREYKDLIDSVTFWGIADDYTWLDDFPVENRKDWPLLFDEKHMRKPAFYGILDLI